MRSREKGEGRREKGRRAAVVLIFIAHLPYPISLVHAAGKNGFQLLDETMSARAAAMGEVASAPGDEVSAVFHNPASTAEARQREVAFSYSAGLAGTVRSSAAYLHPLESATLSAGVRTLNSGTIAAYGVSDNRLGDVQAQDMALTAGYARLTGRAGWGVSVTHISESLAGHSAAATALDGSVIFRPAGWPVRLTAGLRNWGSGATFRQDKTSLPRSMNAGVSYQGFSDALTAALELHRPDGDKAILRGGLEARVYQSLFLRAGFTGGREASTGLTMGAGFQFGRLMIDYAFALQRDGFDDIHRMGVRFLFGGPAEKAYQDALRLSRQGLPAEAILKYEEALDADPRHPGAARGLRDAVKSLEREMREQEDGDK